MDAVTPKANTDLHSRLVRPANMEWQKLNLHTVVGPIGWSDAA